MNLQKKFNKAVHLALMLDLQNAYLSYRELVSSETTHKPALFNLLSILALQEKFPADEFHDQLDNLRGEANKNLIADNVDTWLDTYYVKAGEYAGYRLNRRELQSGRFLYQLIPDVSPLPSECKSRTHCENMRYEWFLKARMYLHVNRIREGSYAEFGCHSAKSFRYALNTIGIPDYICFTDTFYAFDSFKGMPEPFGIDIQETWKQSMNTTTLEQFRQVIKPDLYRTMIVPGYYKESLKDSTGGQPAKIKLAYIDCDYYESTKDVLRYILPRLVHGSLIGFDDYNCYYGDPMRGQRKAVVEFEEEIAGYATIVPFHTIGWGGMSYIFLHESKKGISG